MLIYKSSSKLLEVKLLKHNFAQLALRNHSIGTQTLNFVVITLCGNDSEENHFDAARSRDIKSCESRFPNYWGIVCNHATQEQWENNR